MFKIPNYLCQKKLAILLLSMITPDLAYSFPVSSLPPLEDERHAGCQWAAFLTEPNIIFNKIHFLTTQLAFGTDEKCFWASQDSGLHWESSYCIPTAYQDATINDFQILSPENIWILVGNKFLLHTQDAGNNWSQQAFVGAILEKIHFLDLRSGWLVGSQINSHHHPEVQGVLYATIAGGQSWKKLPFNLPLETPWRLYDLWPVSLTELWGVGDIRLNDSNVLLHSLNGGKSWQMIPVEVTDFSINIEFSNKKIGWVLGRPLYTSHYLLTRDGGQTWTAYPSPGDSHVATLSYTTPMEAWATSFGNVFHTVTGGKSWNLAFQAKNNNAKFHQARMADGMLITSEEDVILICNFSVKEQERFRKEYYQQVAQLSPSKVAYLRKWHSELAINREGIAVDKNLPLMSTAVKMRSVEEIAYQTWVMFLTATKENGLTQDQIQNFITRYTLENYLEEDDRIWLKEANPIVINRSHQLYKKRYESVCALLWVLGYVDKLGNPNQPCHDSFLFKLMQEKSPQMLVEKAKPRPLSDILDYADMIYRYREGTFEGGLLGNETPTNISRKNIDPEIIYHRYQVFQWLLESK